MGNNAGISIKGLKQKNQSLIICYFLDNRQILNAPEIRRVQEYAVFGIQRTYAGDADGEEGAMVARL